MGGVRSGWLAALAPLSTSLSDRESAAGNHEYKHKGKEATNQQTDKLDQQANQLASPGNQTGKPQYKWNNDQNLKHWKHKNWDLEPDPRRRKTKTLLKEVWCPLCQKFLSCSVCLFCFVFQFPNLGSGSRSQVFPRLLLCSLSLSLARS